MIPPQKMLEEIARTIEEFTKTKYSSLPRLVVGRLEEYITLIKNTSNNSSGQDKKPSELTANQIKNLMKEYDSFDAQYISEKNDKIFLKKKLPDFPDEAGYAIGHELVHKYQQDIGFDKKTADNIYRDYAMRTDCEYSANFIIYALMEGHAEFITINSLLKSDNYKEEARNNLVLMEKSFARILPKAEKAYKKIQTLYDEAEPSSLIHSLDTFKVRDILNSLGKGAEYTTGYYYFRKNAKEGKDINNLLLKPTATLKELLVPE